MLASARMDAPSAAARERIWQSVLVAPPLAIVAPQPTAALAKVHVAVSTFKVVLACAVAVGGGAAGYARLAGPSRNLAGTTPPATQLEAPRPVAVTSEPIVPEAAFEIDTATSAAAATPALPGHNLRSSLATARPDRARRAGANDDGLMQEATLVSEARAAILGGRGDAALDALDRATRSGSRALEPEAMALRVRALRLLGRNEEAERVERTLSARFPESFLAH